MNKSLIFSLRHAEVSLVEESLDLLIQSPFKYFEISGELFESSFYKTFKRKCFESEKTISSVFGLIPASLSRNWPKSSSQISSELKVFLAERLSSLVNENIYFAEIDLALDEVTKGQEVFDIEHRSQLISMALAKTKGEIGSLLIPLRFPKALPKSFEWRYTSMLQNKIAHSKLATVVNVFPYECHAESFNDFLKKTFYTAKVMRFCFDPVSDGFLNRESMQRWLQVFCDQGFDGRVILSPRLESSAVLQGSLSQLSLLLKSYEI